MGRPGSTARPPPRRRRPAATATASADASLPGVETPELPLLGPAPDFTGTQRWFNTPDATKLSLPALTAQRRVVLIDFWTYTCINCIRTLPYLKAWDAKYRDKGLTIVGVHTPEFAFEKRADNVAAAIRQNGLRYPVAQDNDFATWNAWGNQYWPAKYLVDADGQVRYTHFGEGDYKETEAAIRALLAEAGDGDLGSGVRTDTGFVPSRAGHAGDLPGHRARPGLGAGAARRHRTTTATAERCPRAGSRSAGRWRHDGEHGTAVRDAGSAPRSSARTCTSCSARRRAGPGACRSASTAALSARPTRAATSATDGSA